MKNKDFAKYMLAGNTTPNGKQNQSVNIVSMVLDGVLCASYYYHSSLIGSLEGRVRSPNNDTGDKLTIQWCGLYTASTAQHINHILSAVGAPKGDNKGYTARRVSYASDRDDEIAARVYIKEDNLGWYLSSVIYRDGTIESIAEGVNQNWLY